MYGFLANIMSSLLTIPLRMWYNKCIMAKFTGKQRIFIDEYLKCLNATEAARRAGYQGTDNVMRVVGSRNLAKANIAEEVARHFAASALSREEVLDRLGQIARAEYTDYLKPDGTIDLEKLLAESKGHLIKAIKETKYGKQIEFYDSQKALVDIGRHHALFIDKHELTGKDGGPIAIKGYLVVSPDDWPEKD